MDNAPPNPQQILDKGRMNKALQPLARRIELKKWFVLPDLERRGDRTNAGPQANYASVSFILLALAVGCAAIPDRASKLDAGNITCGDFFPILPWDPYHGWDGKATDIQTNGLNSIAKCNFNMAGFVLPKDLPLCRKLGLGAIVLPVNRGFTNVDYIFQWRTLSDGEIEHRVREMIDAAGTGPEVKGYFITDEPNVIDFPALAKAVAAVKRYAPGKLAYINLFPNYATMGGPQTQLGTTTYSNYLERFVQEVKPQCLSYDNYGVPYSADFENASDTHHYYQNLLEVRRVALEHQLPCLNIVSANQLGPTMHIPSPASLALQAYTTLAAGYRGVTWYTYYGRGYQYAPIDGSGRRTLTWASLREINRQVATLAPIMRRLISTGVFFSASASAPTLPQLPGQIVKSIHCSEPMMLGEFVDATGHRFVMVVNMSLAKSARFTFDTVHQSKSISVISAMDGSRSKFDPKGRLWLTAGSGVLLSIE